MLFKHLVNDNLTFDVGYHSGQEHVLGNQSERNSNLSSASDHLCGQDRCFKFLSLFLLIQYNRNNINTYTLPSGWENAKHLA